jgi:hypothetical protein
MNWSTVHEFRDWWLKAGRPLRPPFDQPIFVTDMVYSLCLYREGQFQVELYIMKPNGLSPSHSHPGVDSTFVFLGGNLEFGDETESFKDLSDQQKSRNDGAHILLGRTVDALDGALHSVRAHQEGGAFLSFEYWKDKEPDSVVVNWEGAPDGAIHAKVLEK